jgi:hypothetical protein
MNEREREMNKSLNLQVEMNPRFFSTVFVLIVYVKSRFKAHKIFLFNEVHRSMDYL